MEKVDVRKVLVILAAVSMICAMPALCAYGQDVANTPETAGAAEASETTKTTATVATAVWDAETELAFEGFNFYDAAFAQTAAPTYRRKSPFLAWFLSWLYPGIGQFYNGSVGKGITMTALATGGLGICVAAVENEDDSLGAAGALVIVGTSLWSMIDAPISAARINRRNAALTWNVGEGAQLKVRPDIAYENPMKGMQLRRELYCGMSVRMEF
ncbi:MAG: hypothetical protein LBS42_06600 [Tannerella sp.]|jgi:TM2 domain-containing membrane protein YozV|nr:hypothetical protein [Tannerella sp.]